MADTVLISAIRHILENSKAFVNYEKSDFEKSVITVAELQQKYNQMHITPPEIRSFKTPAFAVILIDEGFLQQTWLRSNLDEALLKAWDVHEQHFNVHNTDGYVAVEIAFMDADQPAERIVQWDLDDREVGRLLLYTSVATAEDKEASQ